ncbi:hypothetical protein HRbin17_01294 [bacterium HR17]|jgi:hypothetical protein|uniref:Uncharacterized protein n=1 Tax=Candidatus Fervidibacter japonicus TaxID=2035412 RepID=A0A2H5XC56_9BACT|nr:hypothetical protein HRbin17_01294 [bacterium HR17]
MLQAITVTDTLNSWLCPVCTVVEAVVNRFITHALPDWIASNGQPLNANGGLCPLHAQTLLRWASPIGIAAMYPCLLEQAAEMLKCWQQLGTPPPLRPSPLRPRCLVCAEQRKAEIAAITELLNLLLTDEGRDAYAKGRGVCLPHFCQLWRRTSGDLRRWLLQTQIHQLRQLSADLRSYRQKREALRRQDITPAEETAWVTAVEILAGHLPSMAMPEPR